MTSPQAESKLRQGVKNVKKILAKNIRQKPETFSRKRKHLWQTEVNCTNFYLRFNLNLKSVFFWFGLNRENIIILQICFWKVERNTFESAPHFRAEGWAGNSKMSTKLFKWLILPFLPLIPSLNSKSILRSTLQTITNNQIQQFRKPSRILFILFSVVHTVF